MRLKKRYGLLLVMLLTPLVLVGVVQSVGPPTIYINQSSYGITVYGNNWAPYTDVTIYYDLEDADHMVAVITANYGGYFQTNIPTDYIPTVGVHTVIAVQGADKATAVNNVGTTAPPDDRLLNPILSIQNKLNDVDTEVKAIEAKLDPNGGFYNFVNAWFSIINGTVTANNYKITEINKTIVEKVDYETLEVDIQTIESDTIINAPSVDTLISSTEIGGTDHDSSVYAIVTLGGVNVNALVNAFVKDGLRYIWTNIATVPLETGVYEILFNVPAGVAAGSYLVEVYATYDLAGTTYYGTASYVIECTSATT